HCQYSDAGPALIAERVGGRRAGDVRDRPGANSLTPGTQHPPAAVSDRIILGGNRSCRNSYGRQGMNHEDKSALSRRAVLGGLGATAGVGALGVGLTSGIAEAASPARPQINIDAPIRPEATTPLNPGLRYVVFSGHNFFPLDSTQTYSTLDGHFHLTSGLYAGVNPTLPLGAVIKELELYGTRGAAGIVRLELWKSTVATGGIANTASAVVPAVAGTFTTTVACNDVQDTET